MFKIIAETFQRFEGKRTFVRQTGYICLTVLCLHFPHIDAAAAQNTKNAAPVPEEAQTALSQKDMLAPHKALYDITLTSLRSGAKITNLYGQMLFEWKTDCEAWISDHRSNLFYEYTEGGAVNMTTDFATYEALDGQSMSFNTRREQGGKVFEEFRGFAELEEDGKGVVRYTIPDGLTHQLPQGTLFPMQHTVEILKKARAGEKFFNTTIFDGSDDEGPHDVNVFIAPPDLTEISYTRDNDSIDQDLLDTQSWLLRMAYFPLKEQSESADYEMSLMAHENGVVSYVAIDYEKFSLEQKLVALEKLPEPSCE